MSDIQIRSTHLGELLDKGETTIDGQTVALSPGAVGELRARFGDENVSDALTE